MSFWVSNETVKSVFIVKASEVKVRIIFFLLLSLSTVNVTRTRTFAAYCLCSLASLLSEFN